MPFVRVRSKQPGDPLHEYDVAAPEAAAHPELYEVLDPIPVQTARPATFVAGVVKTPRPRKRPAKRTAKKPASPRPGEDTSTAPAGADS
ncbi:hypothetical protein [Microbacterium sp. NPDC080220]|uniref:hypothetical protein n=1 Tax=Microbacterium sp. NPDC080220 TaxID=3161017 RepID=UPI00343D762D